MGHLSTFGQALSLNARLFGGKTGASDLERSMTFRQWNDRACRLANALLGMGLAKGDRVAVLAYNCVEWMEIYVALAKAGLVAVPVNFRLVGPEIAYIVEQLRGARDDRAGCSCSARSRRSAPTCRCRAANLIHLGGGAARPAGAATRR